MYCNLFNVRIGCKRFVVDIAWCGQRFTFVSDIAWCGQRFTFVSDIACCGQRFTKCLQQIGNLVNRTIRPITLLIHSIPSWMQWFCLNIIFIIESESLYLDMYGFQSQRSSIHADIRPRVFVDTPSIGRGHVTMTSRHMINHIIIIVMEYKYHCLMDCTINLRALALYQNVVCKCHTI